jgi:excisionase family DNA binding protein
MTYRRQTACRPPPFAVALTVPFSLQSANRPLTIPQAETTIEAVFEPRIGRSVSLDQAAEHLGVSRRTIYNRIREGRLRTIRTRGGSQRVLVESMLDERAGAAGTAPPARSSSERPNSHSRIEAPTRRPIPIGSRFETHTGGTDGTGEQSWTAAATHHLGKVRRRAWPTVVSPRRSAESAQAKEEAE